ncbi:2,3-bisphosphoglycerate-independent phosphoglycerate mutase [Vairimorpha necatrix]|uniref:phosphoglycerate mutase (2,3-diphosphoglycerate-independent) n=1 Tax=Vairimorpha necatrix TaxID=6039 RepID=A0AAX4JDS9_9MICR
MKICLIILDGWGHNNKKIPKDPIQNSKCHNMRKLSKKYASYLIHASGKYVGLPEGNMGNSEVGHLTLGSGRIVKQNIILIDEGFATLDIKNKLKNLLLLKLQKLHLIGLVSDGGIHSHISHLIGFLKLLHSEFDEICVHCISDGRDTAPQVFLKFYDEINEKCSDIKNFTISSVSGRFYAMDRDNNNDRIDKYYKTVTSGNISTNIKDYIKNQYENGKNDENIEPALLDKESKIQKDEPILFFNFRADRMRQISTKFKNEGYKIFTLTEYEKNLTDNVIYKQEPVKNTLADVLEANEVEQVHIAETEKYAHVTYFFNGNVEKIHKNEIRKIISSKKVDSFASTPEMSSKEIADEVISNIKLNKQFIVANFAAPDMVGHTGDYEATLKAVDFIDDQIGSIYENCKEQNYVLIITADHGNAEVMYDEIKNVINKRHTNNKVPLIITVPKNVDITGEELDWGYEDSEYSLADVAPTILHLMRIEAPEDFTGTKIKLCNELLKR